MPSLLSLRSRKSWLLGYSFNYIDFEIPIYLSFYKRVNQYQKRRFFFTKAQKFSWWKRVSFIKANLLELLLYMFILLSITMFEITISITLSKIISCNQSQLSSWGKSVTQLPFLVSVALLDPSCSPLCLRCHCTVKWTLSSEFGTYRLCKQPRFRQACASAQSRQNHCCSLIQAVNQEEPSDRKPDPWPFWMAGHAKLKFVMTECSKKQICLTGLRYK